MSNIKFCKDIGGFETRSDIQDVGRFLHNLGDIIWYIENPVLKEKVILEKNWATNGIFQLFFDEDIRKTGHFSKSKAEEIWDQDSNYSYYADTLIEMMKIFRICFPKNRRSDEFIIPALLPELESKDSGKDLKGRTIEYHFGLYVPWGIVNKVTSELYHYIENDQDVWDSGVWLKIENAEARIEEHRFLRKIKIELAGKEDRELFAIIKATMDEIL